MNFQQGLMLAALPLAAIPIIVHLINQRRFQTMKWGAMMFLLAANRMSRGYARIRQWLIMACRILAILGLILAVARPLASGWLGWAGGGRADTTIILLDRSPSMQQTGASGGLSKLDTGRQQLSNALATLGSNRWILIDGISERPREIANPKLLADPALAEPVSSAADLPAMLEQAHEYIEANQSGRTEIWICSDLRSNDWDAEGGRWGALRESFSTFGNRVRFHLLAYPDQGESNLSVRVTEVRRRRLGEGAELLLTLKVTREGETAEGDRQTIPLQIEIDGARSELAVDMVGAQFDLKDHRIPLDKSQVRGWGRVSLPADSNPADNDSFFVFDDPPPRQTVIVSDEANASRSLELAASISPDPRIPCHAEVAVREELARVEWEKLGLLIWQEPLPEGDVAARIEKFVERGGQVLFVAPKDPTPAALFGVHWSGWTTEEKNLPIENWRTDADVLANALSGQALPVGLVEIRRLCGIEGEVIPLASVSGNLPLLSRVPTNQGGVYFLGVSPNPSDSTLATNGVVLYVLVQRMLAAGASQLGSTQQLVAGDEAIEDPANWQRIAGSDDALTTAATHHRGVYSAGERLLALNRPVSEDQATVVGDQRIEQLFEGLEFTRVSDKAGSLGGLVQEIWRLFLGAMLVALVGEAALCLPQTARPAEINVRSTRVPTPSTGGAA